MSRLPWADIAERLGEALGQRVAFSDMTSLSGGSISQAYRVRSGSDAYFIKLHDATQLHAFAAEAEGLQAIASTGAFRCPKPWTHGIAAGRAFLVLEYLAISHRGSESAAGEALAQMHRETGPSYGWHRNNTIGSTPQDNAPSADWADFWARRRLLPQLALAKANGAAGRLIASGHRLVEHLPELLRGHQPPASLLHGDLWGGNRGFDEAGRPVVFDPACYYGDREADLAMTTLFGRAGDAFYAAYQAAWPIAEGFEMRSRLYNLYHILNHYNLFGGGYAAQAEHLMDALLAELR